MIFTNAINVALPELNKLHQKYMLTFFCCKQNSRNNINFILNLIQLRYIFAGNFT